MKKRVYTLFISGWLLLSSSAYAQKLERFGDSLQGSGITSGRELTTFHPKVHQPDGAPHLNQRDLRLRNALAVLTLEIKPGTPIPADVEVRVKVNITGRGVNGREIVDDNVTLTVERFQDGLKSDRFRDGWNTTGAAYVKARIRQVDFFRNGKKTELVVSNFPELLSAISLKLELEAKSSYLNNPNEKPEINYNAVNSQTGNIDLRWNAVQWADAYELEWMHVPDYSSTPGQGIPASALIVPEWRFNASRISTTATSYSITQAFEKGYIIYRIRAIANNSHYNNSTYFGPWQLPTREGILGRGSIAELDQRHYTRVERNMVMTGDRMNWQYVADYREEGNRTEQLNVFDGTLRSRQQINRSEANGIILADQPIYDHQGRKAISMLATPVVQNNTVRDLYSRGLTYQGNLAVDAGGRLYDRKNFDTDAFFSGCTPVKPSRMGTQSGAARYYSPENPDRSEAQSLLPDAEGFPFIRTQWTDDGTNRIASLGSVGQDLQQGSGHESRFMYSIPSQSELDMLFGNNAGFATHYRKIVAIDANGQQSVTYKNLEDNVVATALIGDTPASLNTIGGDSKTMYFDFNSPTPLVSADGMSVKSSGFIHTSIDNVNTRFTYQFTPGILQNSFCGKNYCIDARYQLSIEVRNDCGDVVHHVNRMIQRDDIDCSSGNIESIDASFDLVLPKKGVYSVFKILRVDTSGFDSHFKRILADSLCTDLKPSLVTEEMVNINCNISCQECEEQANMITDPFEREKMMMFCTGICNGTNLTPVQVMRQQMLNDLRPGGQYALWRDTTQTIHPDPSFPYVGYPLSVLNPFGDMLMGNQRASWRTPATPYRNQSGALDSVLINCGNDPGCIERKVSPKDLEMLSDFIRNWKDSWAISLLPYHPEYNYYRYMDSIERASSAFSLEKNFRNALISTTTMRAALDSNFLSLETNPAILDKAVARFGIQAELQDRLTRYQSKPDGSGFFTLSQYVYLSSRCAFLSESQRETCMRQPLGPGLGNTGSDSIDNRDWNIFRALYLKERNRLIDSVVRKFMKDRRLPLNDCIGDQYCYLHYEGAYPLAPAQHLYASKQKRFPVLGENYDNMPFNTLSSDQRDAQEIIRYAGQQDWEKCERCPQVVQLESMLTVMAHNNLLTRPHIMNRESVVPPALLEPLEIRETAQWVPVVTNQNELKVQVRDPKGKKLCEINMMPVGDSSILAQFDWSKIGFVNCLQQTDNSQTYSGESKKKNFTMVAYDALYGSFTIEGHISCLDLTDCEAPRNCSYTCALESYNLLISTMLEKSKSSPRGVIRDNEVSFRRLEECLLAGKNGARIRQIEFTNDRIRINYNWVSPSANGPGKNLDTHCDIDLPRLPISNTNTIELLRLEPVPVSKKECSSDKLMGMFRISNTKSREVISREVHIECASYINCCTPYENDTCISALAGRKWTRGLILSNNRPNVKLEAKDIQLQTVMSSSLATLWQQDVILSNSGIQQVVVEMAYRDKATVTPAEIASLFQFKVGNQEYKGGFEVNPSGNGTYLLKMNIDAGPSRRVRMALSQSTDKSVYNPANWDIREISVKANECESCCTPILPPPAISPQPDCKTLKTAVIKELNERIKNNFRDSLRREWLVQYIEYCVKNARDRFAATYQDKVHHFTLNYYDLAGNLVKTVSPGGVKPLMAEELEAVRRHRENAQTSLPVYPTHTMVTTYEYDSQDQIIRQRSPDAGESRNWYDRLGRLMLVQQANQAAKNAYSYTLYDRLGRIQETGEWNSNRTLGEQEIKGFSSSPHTLNNAVKGQLRRNVVYTQFDQVMNERIPEMLGAGGYNLRGRASSILRAEVLDPQILIAQQYDHASHIRYDIHGNVNRLVIEIPGEGRRNEGGLTKQVDYSYGIISGLIKETRYQQNKSDAFIHRYQYKASGDLESVWTSRNGFWWDRDLTNSYYKHGRLSRIDLGHDGVQGLDMTYTLHGWLKSVNHPGVNVALDPGKDGLGNGVAKDVFGFSMGYYQNDYRTIGRNFELPDVFGEADAGLGLYDGNIRSLVQRNAAFSDQPVQASLFRYDQMDRLVSMQRLLPQDNAWQATESFKTNLTYDPDGNILNVQRNGKDTELGMDRLLYTYKTGSNQLSSVIDEVPERNYSDDIDTQEADNYQYDLSGNLVADRAADISDIRWTGDGKMASITKGRSTTAYVYDANGYRVIKTDKNKKSFYIRDLKGRLLGVYELQKDNVVWKESGLFSASQIGSYIPHEQELENKSVSRWMDFRGQKRYELKNHLSDVVVVVSDKREMVDGSLQAKVITAEDHYPFGSPLPGRKFNLAGHRFGFNAGSERDDDLYGEGNGYITPHRLLDTRLGRWWSVDPKAAQMPSWSPYSAFYNNPIQFVDLDGQAPTREEAARMAAHVYGDVTNSILTGGWRVSSREFGLTNRDLNHDATGLKSLVYERVENGKVTEYTYATAGTEPGWKDIKADIVQPFGLSKQYSKSAENAKRISSELGSTELTFVGHSLGGGEAALNAMLTDRKAVTFNAAGVSTLTKIREGGWAFSRKSLRKYQIDAFIMINDPLATFQMLTPFADADGEHTRLPPMDKKSRFNAHSMFSVLKSVGVDNPEGYKK